MYKVKETLIARYCGSPAEAAADYFGCLLDEMHSDDALFWKDDMIILVTCPNDACSHRIEVLEELNSDDFEIGFCKKNG